MKALGLLGAALLATTASALAAAPEDDDTKSEAREATKEKKICRTEKMTGSLTRVRRICLTRSEWSRLAEGTQKNVDAITRDANQGFAQNPGRAVQGGGQAGGW